MADSVQTAYSRTPARYMAGMLRDIRDKVIESYAAEGTAGIGFGLALVAGTDADKQVKIPTGEGLTVRGISAHRYAIEQASDGTVEYADKEAVNVLRRGIIVVQTAAAVSRDVKAFFKVSGADAGKFVVTDDATTDEFPTGVFRETTTAAGLAIVEINLPGGEAVAS